MHSVKFPHIYLTVRGKKKSPIYICIIHQGQTRYLNSGIIIDCTHLKNGEVVKEDNADVINMKLRETMAALQRFIIVHKLEDKPAQFIIDQFKAGTPYRNFYEYAQNKINLMDAANRFQSANTYSYLLKNLRESGIIVNGLDDINRDMIERFKLYMTKKGLAPNTQGIYLRNLRAIYYAAMDDGSAPEDRNPFRKLAIPKNKAKKKAMKPEELRKLYYSDTPYNLYRDLFFLSFFFCGVNLKDILLASWKDHIIDNRFVFERMKTGQYCSIRIEPEAWEVINRHRGEKMLLNIIEKMQIGEDRNQPAYLDVVQRTNRRLKKIGGPSISSGCARHSWATIGDSLGIPKSIISKGMAHAGSTITDTYIDFDWRLLDNANRRIIEEVVKSATPVSIADQAANEGLSS